MLRFKIEYQNKNIQSGGYTKSYTNNYTGGYTGSYTGGYTGDLLVTDSDLNNTMTEGSINNEVSQK